MASSDGFSASTGTPQTGVITTYGVTVHPGSIVWPLRTATTQVHEITWEGAAVKEGQTYGLSRRKPPSKIVRLVWKSWDRVRRKIEWHFREIEFTKAKRDFKTKTSSLSGSRADSGEPSLSTGYESAHGWGRAVLDYPEDAVFSPAAWMPPNWGLGKSALNPYEGLWLVDLSQPSNHNPPRYPPIEARDVRARLWEVAQAHGFGCRVEWEPGYAVVHQANHWPNDEEVGREEFPTSILDQARYDSYRSVMVDPLGEYSDRLNPAQSLLELKDVPSTVRCLWDVLTFGLLLMTNSGAWKRVTPATSLAAVASLYLCYRFGIETQVNDLKSWAEYVELLEGRSSLESTCQVHSICTGDTVRSAYVKRLPESLPAPGQIVLDTTTNNSIQASETGYLGRPKAVRILPQPPAYITAGRATLTASGTLFFEAYEPDTAYMPDWFHELWPPRPGDVLASANVGAWARLPLLESPPLLTAWELTPYSWLIDYFSTIGKTVERWEQALTQPVKVRARWLWDSLKIVKRFTWCRPLAIESSPPSVTAYMDGEAGSQNGFAHTYLTSVGFTNVSSGGKFYYRGDAVVDPFPSRNAPRPECWLTWNSPSDAGTSRWQVKACYLRGDLHRIDYKREPISVPVIPGISLKRHISRVRLVTVGALVTQMLAGGWLKSRRSKRLYKHVGYDVRDAKLWLKNHSSLVTRILDSRKVP